MTRIYFVTYTLGWLSGEKGLTPFPSRIIHRCIRLSHTIQISISFDIRIILVCHHCVVVHGHYYLKCLSIYFPLIILNNITHPVTKPKNNPITVTDIPNSNVFLSLFFHPSTIVPIPNIRLINQPMIASIINVVTILSM